MERKVTHTNTECVPSGLTYKILLKTKTTTAVGKCSSKFTTSCFNHASSIFNYFLRGHKMCPGIEAVFVTPAPLWLKQDAVKSRDYRGYLSRLSQILFSKCN